MSLDISVIICTYNRDQYLAGAMRSLTEQDFDRTRFETIVVNNNSKDETERVCKEFIETHPGHLLYYYNETEQGSSPARNKGARHAKGTVLIFMDDDAVAEKDFF